MKQLFKVFLFALPLVALLLYASLAHADKVVASRTSAGDATGRQQHCTMQETGTVNISINGSTQDAGAIKTLFEGKLKEIEAIAAAEGVTKMEMQSFNYGANANNSGGCGGVGQGGELTFQYYGNASYKVDPADKVAGLSAALAAKGHIAGFNVNVYRQCQ